MTAMLFMSSTDHLVIVYVAFAILISRPVCAQDKTRKAPLSCPASIEVTETAGAVSGWKIEDAKAKRAFERISIYNGTNGDREFELAPDDQKEERSRITQTWYLRGYRSMNMFLRCRYSGTQVVLSKDIPEGLETCVFAFSSDKSGKITGTSSFVCR
jgi:hypothetical protein